MTDQPPILHTDAPATSSATATATSGEQMPKTIYEAVWKLLSRWGIAGFIVLFAAYELDKHAPSLVGSWQAAIKADTETKEKLAEGIESNNELIESNATESKHRYEVVLPRIEAAEKAAVETQAALTEAVDQMHATSKQRQANAEEQTKLLQSIDAKIGGPNRVTIP